MEGNSIRLEEILSNVSQVFLDTAPVIYFVERHPEYSARVQPIFDAIDDGSLSAVTSPITLAECLVVPIRSDQESVQQDFTDLIVSGTGVTFAIIDDAVAQQAANLRARYNLSLIDAFQAATALAAGCDAFLTNDSDLVRVTELHVIVVDELETENLEAAQEGNG